MAVIFKTNSPDRLLQSFKKKIDVGTVATWSYDSDGDFTHTPEQWKHKAWMRPHIKNGELVFTVVKQKQVDISSLVYGIYHGRLIESFLVHLDKEFIEGYATAMPVAADQISS